MAHITPVIMSGGAGTRLWPLSRRDRPKQLHALGGADTLLAETLKRLRPGPDGLFAPPVIVCAESQADAVRAAVAGADPAPRLMLEPVARNTAACAATVSAWLASQGEPGRLILLAPADHRMASAAPFRAAVAGAMDAARNGRLVTFGVTPDRPETGFGYIRLGEPLGGIFEAEAFVEKPDLATAKRYVVDGGHVWNAGYFLFRADRMLEEMERLQPEIADSARRAVSLGVERAGAFVLDGAALEASPSDSLDYAVMEKAASVAVAPFQAGWSDLGSWQAVWEASERDAAGNAVCGEAAVFESKDCLVLSDGPQISVIGVEDLVVIATGDAVLVVPRARAQDVRGAVEALKAAGRDDLL